MDKTKKKGRKPKKKNAYQCEICAGNQNEPVVACDKCDKWHHFACVGIKSIGKKDAWFCDNCKTKPTDPLTSILPHQSVPESVIPSTQKPTSPSVARGVNREDNHNDYDLRYDKSHQYYRADQSIALSSRRLNEDRSIDQTRSRHIEPSVPSISNFTRTGSNRREMELEIIQEERFLSQKRDHEYLVKKYSILMKGKQRSDRISAANDEIQSIAQTKEWVEKQQAIKSRVVNSELNKTDRFNEDEFTRRLDELKLGTSLAVRHESPARNRNQPRIQGINNLLQCEECKMVGEDENFDACLLCFKQYHYACLDIMMLDDESHYICTQCKNLTSRNSPRSISIILPSMNKKSVANEFKSKDNAKTQVDVSIQKEQSKQAQRSHVLSNWERISYGKSSDKDLPRCATCNSTNGQEKMKPCDICDELIHFSCMTLATIDGDVMWICNRCKEGQEKPTPTNPVNKDPVQIKSTMSNEMQPGDKTSGVTINAMKTDDARLSTGASQTLTSAQIASRHVVTRDLPIFVGKPEQWPMFRSRFDNSTKLCGFSDSENLDRLQKCLKGNALEAVRSRLLTAESVPDIMSTLEMLYGRPELIVNSLMRKIRSEPPPKADKLNTLVDFALSVKNVCATLEQANLNSHLSNPALVQELVDKLPTNIKIEWARYKATVMDLSLSTLARFLYDLAKVISTVTEPTVNKESKDDYKPKTGFNKRDNSQKETSQDDSAHVYAHQSKLNKRQTTAGGKADSNQSSTQCVICKKMCEKVEKCSTFLGYDIERRWKEMYEHKLCRKCLDKHGRFCTQAKVCGVNGCIFKHHSLLHDEKRHSSGVIQTPKPEALNNNVHFTVLRNILLRIVPVTIYFNTRYIKTYAYQDDGSDVSMIERSLITSLGITGTVEPLCLMWTADVHRKENDSIRVDVEISGQGEFVERYKVRDTRTVESLGLPVQTLIKEKLVEYFPYLRDIPLLDYVNAIPRILIGSDNANLNVPLEIVEGNFSQPVACKTRIGWSLNGRTDDRERKSEVQVVNIHRTKCPCQIQIDEETHRLVKEHFSVENFGVQVNKNLQFCSKEDERALSLLQKYTRRVDNRYETGLLWRYDDIRLPDSYKMAYKRLQCLEKHKPETIEAINTTILEYLRKGYASKLTDEEISDSKITRKWYLPIFTVFYPKKPNKIRVVFDGAAKVNNVSLNSLLLKGPDQLSSLIDILRRFREKKVASAGDITEMFPQIKIRREDVHVQRFLWRNGDKSKEPEHYVLERMTFGASCSPASAQFVKNKNASEFEKEYPRAVEAIHRNHYVDDMLECQHTDNEMIRLIKEVKKIHLKAGFEIRKFLSNSAAVMKEVNVNQENLESNLDISFGTERVLGMWWNTKTDTFTYSLKFTHIDEQIVSGNRMPTKRELLKILMSIFDPLGLLSHYLIHLKIIIQYVWRTNLDWDDEISATDIQVEWRNWFELLPNVEKIEIPRLYTRKCHRELPSQ